jgi:hypothetical protein
VVWKIDGTTECTQTTNIPSTPMFPILDLAVGGASVGSTISGLPSTNQIDYIRVTTNSPVNSAVPTISGTLTHGNAISVTNGSWSGSPTGFTYQWQRCSTTVTGSNPSPCQNISGATSSSYTLQVADEGSVIQAVVTASNATGASASTTAQTAAIT